MCYRCEREAPTDEVEGFRPVNATYALRLGLNPNLDLAKQCAEFYMLERLEADGSKVARRMLKEKESKLAREFADYLTMACGGEIRHMTRMGSSGSCDCGCMGDSDYCQCSDGCDEDCEHPCYGGKPPEGTWEGYPKTSKYCYSEEPHDFHYVKCGNCWDEEIGGCSWSMREPTEHETPDVSSILADLLSNTGHDGPDGGRSDAWDVTRSLYANVGSDLLQAMADGFNLDIWEGGYGGPAWATVAQLVHDFITGRISVRVFLNMAWSAEHNGGCVFNKAYSVKRLPSVLDAQARDDYDTLANYVCRDIARLWEYRPYALRGTVPDPIWLGREIEEVAW